MESLYSEPLLQLRQVQASRGYRYSGRVVDSVRHDRTVAAGRRFREHGSCAADAPVVGAGRLLNEKISGRHVPGDRPGRIPPLHGAEIAAVRIRHPGLVPSIVARKLTGVA